MAEIKITKKKPIWPWVLLILILLAALAYFYYESTQAEEYDLGTETGYLPVPDGGQDAVPGDTAAAWLGTESLTEAYLALVSDRTRLAADSSYTRRVLLSLGDAVRLTAEREGMHAGFPLQAMESRLDQVESAGSDKGLPYHIQSVGEAMVVVFQTLDTSTGHPSVGQVQAASRSVAAINPDEEMHMQKEVIRDFFDALGALLLEMN